MSEVQVETSLSHKVVNKENQYGLRQMVWDRSAQHSIFFNVTDILYKTNFSSSA
jgi:hypothetical protein